MMTRMKLREIKRAMHKFDFTPSIQVTHALVDSNLDALDKLESDQAAVELRKLQGQVAEREHQLDLALADLAEAVEDLAVTANDSMHPEYGVKARYMLHQIQLMLKAKGPRWHREWSHYWPRIEEEFSD